MDQDLSVRQWVEAFGNGDFYNDDVKTQIRAGWYDWFCKGSSLRNKTYKMGNIVRQIKDGGKIDLDNWYVWFKNNCPLNGPLYDDFRFADLENGNVQFTIQIACCWNKHRYCVYGRRNEFKEPLYECDSSRELIKWINKPWDD